MSQWLRSEIGVVPELAGSFVGDRVQNAAVVGNLIREEPICALTAGERVGVIVVERGSPGEQDVFIGVAVESCACTGWLTPAIRPVLFATGLVPVVQRILHYFRVTRGIRTT